MNFFSTIMVLAITVMTVNATPVANPVAEPVAEPAAEPYEICVGGASFC